MEDGWVLAQALALFGNDTSKALPLFDAIRLPYYARMYAHLDAQSKKRAEKLKAIPNPSFDQRVENKLITGGGVDMSWIYSNHIGRVWEEAISRQPSVQTA